MRRLMRLPFRLRRVGLRFQAAWRLTSFELIVCAEHAIDRSAHLFQNKSWRHATHHFELIRLAWTYFKSIGFHSFDGNFNHVFHLHDRNAFHVFRIKVTQEFGLSPAVLAQIPSLWCFSVAHE